MSEQPLLCDRPHVSRVDFKTARFVVGRESGIDIGTDAGVRHLRFGEEVPAGALTEYALKLLYTYPAPHMIETVEYAMKLPDLAEACAREGVAPDPPSSGGGEEEEPAAGALEEEEPDEESSDAGEEASKEEASPGVSSLADLDKLSKRQLSDLCYRMGLNSNGSRQALRERAAAGLAKSVDRRGRAVRP